MKILLINFHNRENSFCSALASSYENGANVSGHLFKSLNVRELELEKYLKYGHEKRYEPEGDIAKAQKLISWADHLVCVYPTWWAGPPAVMRLFFEMVLSPGFAFKYHEQMTMIVSWDKLLSGKTARLISTMDAPPWYYRWILGNPGGKMMKAGILGFCGLKPIKTTYFGSVKLSTKKKREQWIKTAYTLGKKGK
jgi:NAD(P)H dehydrogenase (quinone)